MRLVNRALNLGVLFCSALLCFVVLVEMEEMNSEN